MVEMMYRLPIEVWEVGLYERLLTAPHNIFSALLAGILRGRWSVHDLVPLLPERDALDGDVPEDDILPALLEKIGGGRHPLETTPAAALRERTSRLASAEINAGFADWMLTSGERKTADSAWTAGAGLPDAERKRIQLEGMRLAGPE